MATYFSIDEKLDFNSLFKIDFNILKEVIEVLINTQKSVTLKVDSLENTLHQREKQITK